MSGRIHAGHAVGAGMVGLGLVVIWQALAIPLGRGVDWGPRYFPLAVAICLVVLGALEVKAASRTAPAEPSSGKQTGRVLVLVLISALYVFFIGRLGYLIPTALAAPAVLWLFGMRRVWGLAATAVLCPAIYHMLFFELLGVFPPFAAWFDPLEMWR